MSAPAPVLAYSGGGLDRAAARRGDDAWLAAARADPASRVLPMWRDRCLVDGAGPLALTGAAAAAVREAAAEPPVLLGLDGAVAVFAADLSPLDEPAALRLAGASAARDVRALVTELGPADAAAYGHARGILHWHREQRFCGACGAPTGPRQGGSIRACAGCGKLLFPRIEPAVITLVESAGRCLLARHAGAPPDGWSTLAGFVEVGESLEDAVRREVAEEAGVRVGEVAYVASQAWPFPAGLMVGFRASAMSERVAVDGTELVEARWFTRAEARALIAVRPRRPDAIDRYLLDAWLARR
jgi:NAD+ diphosphatase